MYIIGLTGGIGTGKSTVSKHLESKGCLILDADAISRLMTEKGQPALTEIAKMFGSSLIDKDGKEQKSESREENGFEFRPVGYGIQNFPAILESAEKSGTEYVIVEQDSFVDIAPLEAVKKSREYLKTLGL